MIKNLNNFYSIAPMMGKTDSYFCFLMKIINEKTYIYSEMMHSETIIRTNILDKYKILKNLSNIAIQIAGNCPKSMAIAAKKASGFGFSEININCGCPSKNVLAGEFGLSLLNNPSLVRKCATAIKNETNTNISVKTRIGIDYIENDKLLDSFLYEVNLSGIKKYIIHARNGILGKLSTKKNLTIPPLKYERVFNLKNKFHSNDIIINGGFLNTLSYEKYKNKIDGIMIGREAYKNPWIFSNKEILFKDKIKIVIKYIEGLKKYFVDKRFNNQALHHIQNIFNNNYGAKDWRIAVNKSINNNDLQYLLNYIKCNKLGDKLE